MVRSLPLLSSLTIAGLLAGCAQIHTDTTIDAAAQDLAMGEDGFDAGPDVYEAAPVEVASMDDGPRFSSDSTGTSVDSNCGAMTHTAMKLLPDILIVQDRSLSMLYDQNDQPCTASGGTTGSGGASGRSGSGGAGGRSGSGGAGGRGGVVVGPPVGGGPTGMFNNNCGSMSKWSQVTTALHDVLTMTDSKVNWGLLYFGDETTTCGETAAPVVPVGPAAGAAITQAFVGQPNLSGQIGTPTRSAINNAVTYMKSLTDTNPKYLMLATDGEPNCASNNDANSDDSVGAEQAISTALTAGLPTFVIGIGNTGDSAVLSAMAVAGGKPVAGMPGGNSYYQVNNTSDLETALGQILGTVATCVFDVGPPPNDMTTADQISVFGDGTMIPKDPSNGWDFSSTDKTQVTIYGSICDQVKAGTIMNVTVAFGCLGAR